MDNFGFKQSPNIAGTNRLLNVIYVAMFTAIIAVSAQISIPTAIPFTLQTLGVFVAGAMLGWKRSTLSVFIYILLAVVGVPVLANFSGGFDKVIGITGGYIIGFIFTAFIVGMITDKFGRKTGILIISMVAGLMVCYLFGTVWFCVISQTTFTKAIMLCVVPYLLFDALKIIVATVLVNRLDKIIKL